MDRLKRLAKRCTLRLLTCCIGRRNLVRLGRFLLNGARLDGSNAIGSNGEELVQDVLLANAAPAGDLVVFDVGANVGEWSQSLLGRCPGPQRARLRLFAFEPCQATFETLSRTLAEYADSAHLTTVHLALSNVAGSAELNVVGDGAGTNSLHAQLDQPLARKEAIELQTVVGFCRQAGLERVHLLKIDTEGHDLAVIEGALEMGSSAHSVKGRVKCAGPAIRHE